MRRKSSVSSFKDDNDIEKERELIFEDILQNGIPELPEGWVIVREAQPDQSSQSSQKTSVSASEYKKFKAWQEGQSVSCKSKASRYSHRSLTSQQALAAKDEEIRRLKRE
jgi:hypothetical protein